MATQTTPPTVPETVDTSRFEQVNGKLVERAVLTLDHGNLQYQITTVLRSALSERGHKSVQEVSIDRRDEIKSDWLTPDIIVSTAGEFQKAKNGHVLPPLLLAVEVLSSGQDFFNMRRKVADLLAWGVQQVWLVDRDSRSIAVFQSPDASKSETFYEGSLSLTGTGLSFPLNELFGG